MNKIRVSEIGEVDIKSIEGLSYNELKKMKSILWNIISNTKLILRNGVMHHVK